MMRSIGDEQTAKMLMMKLIPGRGKRFNEFIKLLDMEPVNLAEEIRKDMPGVAKLFRL
jgi:hypothetical protein